MELGCSLPPLIALCYPLSVELTRLPWFCPPCTQSDDPITLCAATAGSVCGASAAYRLSRLGILHRRIRGAVFDRVTAFLHGIGDLCPHDHRCCPYAVASASARLPRNLTSVAQKPSLVIEQATSSYSFRSPELSQSI